MKLSLENFERKWGDDLGIRCRIVYFFRSQSSVTKRLYWKLSAHEMIALRPKPPTPDTYYELKLHKKFTFMHLTDLCQPQKFIGGC